MKRWIIGGLIAVVVVGAAVVAFKGRGERGGADSQSSTIGSVKEAGKRLAGSNCKGTGPGTLTHSAMDPEDFNFIIPYGLMVGGHVSPIDHQYYSPADYQSERDAYPVYAMGDANLVEIQHRTEQPQDNAKTRATETSEYRLVFAQTCTSLYYYDLLTDLEPKFKEALGGKEYGGVNVPVKGGELIGHIGGQTLDFAVWDTEKPLPGFIVPEHYETEAWKIYTADPLDYYTPELKEFMLSRYVRTAEPVSGKIDWDVDGTLRGNWFLEGTDAAGLRGDPRGEWVSHLSFAPDLYDPSRWIVSMGDYPVVQDNDTQVSATQLYAKTNAPAPETVTPASGLVKLDLVHERYVTPDGKEWDQQAFATGIKVGTTNEDTVKAVALIELTTDRALKFEVIPGTTAAEVSGFTANVKTYTR